MRRLFILILLLLMPLFFSSCDSETDKKQLSELSEVQVGENAVPDQLEKATFAGGCFWCMEPPYEKLKGVYAAISGYAGGETKNPTYKEVAAGGTGHAEVVQIHYDPAQVSYQTLLDTFWRNIDPTAVDRQFVDKGDQYRSAIFYHNEEQRKLAEASKEALDQSGRFPKPVVTEISPLDKFYRAEDYHQDYYKTNPGPYKVYRYFSGRDSFIKKYWADKGADKKDSE